MNLAIVDDNDVYMGTVSLKHIDRTEGNAEKGTVKTFFKAILGRFIDTIFRTEKHEKGRSVRFMPQNGNVIIWKNCAQSKNFCQ